MAAISSTQNGNYSTGATWVGGVAPVTTDDATVLHDVTVTGGTAAAKTITVKTNGELIQEDTIEFDDTAGAGLTIEDDGNYSNNGSASSPVTIQSAGGDTPTNRWDINVEDVVGTDSRTLGFTYVEFVGGLFYLGNDNNSIDFNGGADDDPIITMVSPPAPLPRIVEHDIDGRDAGRVYPRGRSARVITLSGTTRHDSWVPQQLDDMEKAGLRISFFSRHYHFPRCRIEQVSFPQSIGTYLVFTITVREDV